MKIEKSEKCQQSPGVEPRTPLACMSALPLSHNSQTTTNPHSPLYMYYTGGTECFSRTPGSHSACAIRTWLVVEVLSIRKEPMMSGFFTLNAQNILPHVGKTQDTSDLSHQCSATEPQQQDDHQFSQSLIYNAQVALNASVTHLAATQYVPSELRKGLTRNSLHQERTHAEWFSHSKCSEHLASCWK